LRRFWTVQDDACDRIVAITEHIGFNVDVLADGSFDWKTTPINLW
jgi:hypothetical protein